MTDKEILLSEASEGLAGILKPYQCQVNRCQQMANLVRQCIRCADKNNFLELDEILRNKLMDDITNEDGLDSGKAIFDRLRVYVDGEVDRYRIEFIDDLKNCADEAELPLEIDFPRFTILKGIDGHIYFSSRQATINEKKLKSIDPKRIVALAIKIKKQLYDRHYDPQQFIDGIYRVYHGLIKRENKSGGDAISMQQFYQEYTLSLQSKIFFQNMDKGKFRGYSLNQFSVDLWRYFQSDTSTANDKFVVQLRPGRNSALWLIDMDGERRQITTISFQER